MRYFLDTSVLLKIYHREDESDKIIKIYNSNDVIIISELATVEIFSAIYKKVRQGILTEDDARKINTIINDDMLNRFKVLRFASYVTLESKKLLDEFAFEYSLRTLDALQLAFYITYCEKDDVFLSTDKTLQEVASRHCNNYGF
ncbi:MAG: type II toxin-antitoxin system VapC family toxin [Campylobacterales bacterium]